MTNDNFFVCLCFNFGKSVTKMSNKKPHKHAELIKAWADGAEIEVKVRVGHEGEYGKEKWWPVGDDISWHKHFEYRIKPEPKPDYVEYFWATFTSVLLSHKRNEHNLKLTFDGETGKLKSAEVL